MDYNRPLNVSKDNQKVHIALAMVPGAGHNESGHFSKSPLLINPGGPGGAGAFFALGIGKHLQTIVSADGSQDIVGFDPRGVGATTPKADCWTYPSNGKETSSEDAKAGAFKQMIWSFLGAGIPRINTSEGALGQYDARARAVSKVCEYRDEMDGENSILRHVSSPAVARDMLSIIDAWDEWQAETQKVDATHSEELQSIQLEDDAYSLDTKAKLVYWGFSYGTLLGATFAAMFPDRVGRVLLDGVVDADYYVSPIWAQSQRDADSVEASFYHYCLQAGGKCSIYRENDTETTIKNRVQSVLYALEKQPLSSLSTFDHVPLILTADNIKYNMFAALYAPMGAFPGMAILLDALYRQDTEQILRNIPVIYPSYKPFCDSEASPYPASNAQLAIMCTDKRYPLNETLPNLEKRFEAMANISHFADVWMGLMIGCDSFNITPTDPPMRWDNHPAHKQTPIKTSFPLMFLSNRADPVTPLFAGVKMTRKFVDAGLVEQNSEGHCSLAAVSRCTLGRVRAYFEDGKVPDHPKWGPKGEEIEKGIWNRCDADEWPWHPYEEEGSEVKTMEAWRSARQVSSAFFRPTNAFGLTQPLLW